VRARIRFSQDANESLDAQKVLHMIGAGEVMQKTGYNPVRSPILLTCVCQTCNVILSDRIWRQICGKPENNKPQSVNTINLMEPGFISSLDKRIIPSAARKLQRFGSGFPLNVASFVY
jgi:hypothetical protein